MSKKGYSISLFLFLASTIIYFTYYIPMSSVKIELQSFDLGEIAGIKYKVLYNGKNMSFKQTMELFVKMDVKFIELLNAVLTVHEAVFWECIPVDFNSFGTLDFEFVVLPSKELSHRTVDMKPFREKFENLITSEEQLGAIISFSSLNGDSLLVVPSPPISVEHFNNNNDRYQMMTHLASYLRESSFDHVCSFLRTVGERFTERLTTGVDSGSKLWLSTSGLGVSWLHVRIDTIPKYYNYLPYRNG